MTRLSYPAYLNKKLSELEQRLSEGNRKALCLYRHLVIKYLTVEDLGERRECEEELRKLGLSEGDLEQLKAYAKAIMDEYYRECAAEMRERLAGRWRRRARL